MFAETTRAQRAFSLQVLAGAKALIPESPSIALTPGEVACLLDLALESPTLEEILGALAR